VSDKREPNELGWPLITEVGTPPTTEIVDFGGANGIQDDTPPSPPTPDTARGAVQNRDLKRTECANPRRSELNGPAIEGEATGQSPNATSPRTGELESSATIVARASSPEPRDAPATGSTLALAPSRRWFSSEQFSEEFAPVLAFLDRWLEHCCRIQYHDRENLLWTLAFEVWTYCPPGEETNVVGYSFVALRRMLSRYFPWSNERFLPIPEEGVAKEGLSPVEEVVREEDRRQVSEALGRLDELDREVLTFGFSLGYSHNKVANKLGISEVAARKRRQRALGNLARQLGLRESGEAT
jgi:RNA polymerase sigma factor (sigma-70 family)